MKIDYRRLEMELARRCITISDLRMKGLSPQTLTRIRSGADVKPVTLGRIAKALGVDPAAIVDEEE